MPLSTDGDIIEFGRFRLQRRERKLLADGLKLELGTRAIEVLLELIDAGGKIVTKDELLDRVWSGVIVEENNLHVTEPVAHIVEALLHGAPHLRILATSRAPLRAEGERV